MFSRHIRRAPSDEQLKLVRDFLALPNTALPSATQDGDGPDDSWERLRLEAKAVKPTQGRWGEEIYLRADRDGWREGVIVRA